MFSLLLAATPCLSQNLNGLWKGAITAGDSMLLYELLITGEDGKYINGYGQTTFIINGVENVGVKEVKLRRRSNAYQFEDFELVYNDYTTTPRKIKLFADLGLYYDGPFAMLKGSFYTRAMELNAKPGPFAKGTLWLRKEEAETAGSLPKRMHDIQNGILATAQVKPPRTVKTKPAKPAKETVARAEKPKEEKTKAKPPAASSTSSGGKAEGTTAAVSSDKKASATTAPVDRADAASPREGRGRRETPDVATPGLPDYRITVVIRELEIESDSITFSLYDNGEIDGDTVSISLNRALLVDHLGLTAGAATYQLKLDSIPSDTVEIVLFAENLGRIPPNTGILILQDGEKRYDIGFTGDLSVSPAIVLRRKRQ
ncbi:MAG TPA: hypothetical protein VK907_06315 [Phnomibacter sp.]|nr:hypothetical protein [Phnomibacter sp.]